MVEGLGCSNARLRVHMGNRPPLMPFTEPDGVMPLLDGDIARISQAGGNGWRKLFSVYAKLVWALPDRPFAARPWSRWQDFRDGALLQPDSDTALLFSDPQPIPEGLQILMGKSFGLAATGRAGIPLCWLDAHFAVSPDKRTIVCPYFDYRQLTNARIDTLVTLMRSLHH
ncbi:hypothetical protein KUW19_03795 [Ferrimonas balearica]|uniref:DUF6942 family protein n=1 Tax=Ferrimonas balearica TaxID=44012 RepID=UPI001C96ADC0|nr:hypothetical protein [Ferrimonas balearica]MBY6105612.1 hypothetical protein [Ferrimonas balearica]